MRIPSARIGTSFPDELLSMEQNKDAPGLNKATMVWIFSGGLPLPGPGCHLTASNTLPLETIRASATDPVMSPVLASSHANLPPTFVQVCGLVPLRDSLPS